MISALVVVLAIAARSAGAGSDSFRVDLDKRTVTALHAPLPVRPPPSARAGARASVPCVVVAGDPRNWIAHQVAVDGGDVCVTRAFLPGVDNDFGRDVVEGRDASGKRRYQFALAGTADQVVVDGKTLVIAGAGGVSALDAATGRGKGLVPVAGFASWAQIVDGVVVARIGDHLVGVALPADTATPETAADEPRLLWDAHADDNLARGGAVRCGDVVVEPVVTRVLTPRAEGMPSTRGALALQVIAPRTGTKEPVPVLAYDQFFDDAIVDVRCREKHVVDVAAVFIVLD